MEWTPCWDTRALNLFPQLYKHLSDGIDVSLEASGPIEVPGVIHRVYLALSPHTHKSGVNQAPRLIKG